MKILYGIKNCDTVKKARKWLDHNAVDYRFHDFRSDGLAREQILRWTELSDWQTLLNQRSTSWRRLDDAQKSDLTEAKAIQLMLTNPTLIKRPVLDTGSRVIVGFKAEVYQTALRS
ncbi:MAG: ArsC family reductase [Gammaproteobacteria bacterium]